MEKYSIMFNISEHKSINDAHISAVNFELI